MSDLMQQLPSYYRRSQVTKNFTDSGDFEMAAFITAVENLLKEFFVDQAESSLSRWEVEYGIPVNASKPAEYRRSVVKSKIRGQGTITVFLIKTTCESYSNGEVDVSEDNSNYSFKVTFVGTVGIPPNLDDLKARIEDIKPAHLVVGYEFIYMIFDDFDAYNKTWDQWDTLDLTWDEFTEYSE